MSTTRITSTFDLPDLAWQRHRYTTRYVGSQAENATANSHNDDDTTDDFPDAEDEPLFDDDYESDSETESDSGVEPIFDDVTPNVTSIHNIASKRYQEIIVDVCMVASRIEDYTAVVEACIEGPLERDFVLTETHREIYDCFGSALANLDYRMCNILDFIRPFGEGPRDIEESEQFMRDWGTALEPALDLDGNYFWILSRDRIEDLLRETEYHVDRVGKALESLDALKAFQDRKLMVRRQTVHRLFHPVGIFDNEKERYDEVETWMEKIIADMGTWDANSLRALNGRDLKGSLAMTRHHVFWDMEDEGEEYENRESWLEDLLGHVETHRIAVRTCLRTWAGEVA